MLPPKHLSSRRGGPDRSDREARCGGRRGEGVTALGFPEAQGRCSRVAEVRLQGPGRLVPNGPYQRIGQKAGPRVEGSKPSPPGVSGSKPHTPRAEPGGVPPCVRGPFRAFPFRTAECGGAAGSAHPSGDVWTGLRFTLPGGGVGVRAHRRGGSLPPPCGEGGPERSEGSGGGYHPTLARLRRVGPPH